MLARLLQQRTNRFARSCKAWPMHVFAWEHLGSILLQGPSGSLGTMASAEIDVEVAKSPAPAKANRHVRFAHS